MELYQSLITVDPWTLLAQMCNLLIQLLIFKKLLLEPVRKVLAERKAKADSEIGDAQKLRAEAEAMKAEYEKNMAEAKAEANSIVTSAQKTATARSEQIVGEARNAAANIKRKAEEDIALERKKAINEVKDEIGGMAMDIASKVVEREIDQKDHQELIDEFIRNVGEASCPKRAKCTGAAFLRLVPRKGSTTKFWANSRASRRFLPRTPNICIC